MTYDLTVILRYCGKSSLWRPGLDCRLPQEAVSEPLLTSRAAFGASVGGLGCWAVLAALNASVCGRGPLLGGSSGPSAIQVP